MVITIELLCAEIPAREITFRRLPVTIGRGPETDVPLEDCCVSRQHCKLAEVDGKPFVCDLDSTNGTFLNGEMIQQAVVEPDDRITVGQTDFRVRFEAP